MLGTVIPNRKYRDYDCRRGKDGAAAEKGECDKLYDKLLPSLRGDCNSAPCVLYGYKRYNWGVCSCDEWSEKRTVKCTNVNDGSLVATSYCKASRVVLPEKERACFPDKCFKSGSRKDLDADYCQFSSCSSTAPLLLFSHIWIVFLSRGKRKMREAEVHVRLGI